MTVLPRVPPGGRMTGVRPDASASAVTSSGSPCSSGVVAALAARADLPIDRLADAQLVASALVRRRVRHAPDGDLCVGSTPAPRGWASASGPLHRGARRSRDRRQPRCPASGRCSSGWSTPGACDDRRSGGRDAAPHDRGRRHRDLRGGRMRRRTLVGIGLVAALVALPDRRRDRRRRPTPTPRPRGPASAAARGRRRLAAPAAGRPAAPAGAARSTCCVTAVRRGARPQPDRRRGRRSPTTGSSPSRRPCSSPSAPSGCSAGPDTIADLLDRLEGVVPDEALTLIDDSLTRVTESSGGGARPRAGRPRAGRCGPRAAPCRR